MTLTPEIVVVAALVVVVAYLVFGLTGFGSTVIALPLLVYVLPIKFAVPLLMLLDFAAFLTLGLRVRRGIRFDEIGRVASLHRAMGFDVETPVAALVTVAGFTE